MYTCIHIYVYIYNFKVVVCVLCLQQKLHFDNLLGAHQFQIKIPYINMPTKKTQAAGADALSRAALKTE